MVLNCLIERTDVMSVSAIEAYFGSKLHKPFYAVVGDEDYVKEYEELVEQGADIIRLSDCFCDVDKLPDLDLLREKLRTVDVNCESNKAVVIGLGEYLSLMGLTYAYAILDELKDFNLGSAQVVFLLRGMYSVVSQIRKGDPRFDNRRSYIADNIDFNIRILLSSSAVRMFKDDGLRNLIFNLEGGADGELRANSDLRFEDSVLSITVLESPYDEIIRRMPGFNLPIEMGKVDYWGNLLQDLSTYNYSLDKYFESKDYISWPLADLYDKLVLEDYSSWSYYIFLVEKYKNQEKHYLKYVARNSQNQQEFLDNVLYLIISVPHTDRNFEKYYIQRKELIKKYPESEIAQFIVENRKFPEESIYKLTDNTEVEKEEIITNVSRRGFVKELKDIYPQLYYYMDSYFFPGDAFIAEVSTYFNKYRMLKVANRIDDDFLEMVDDLAKKREYNRLQTRDELVARLDDGKTFLCWVDALGAEYAGYLVQMAKKKGLSVLTRVGRADLPTLTTINKGFYENWTENCKTKIEELDDIKHKEKGGFKWTDNQLPIHLAKELQILSQVVDQAATVLGLQKYDKYILTGDHGASRLAVLRNKEEKYETDTKGEHSGRCCKAFENYDLPFATEENGYVILADYGRFKGSRKANVEVHGGASLEEVCVPVIELSLRDNELLIEVLDEIIATDYRNGAVVHFFVNKCSLKKLVVEINGREYMAEKKDDNHYDVELEDVKKAGTYTANLYTDDRFFSSLELRITGKSGTINDDFDDIFS